MGGKALKDFGVSRLDQATYERVSNKALSAVNATLATFDANEKARLVPSWREKTDHGDIDIVVPEDSFEGNYGKLLKALAKTLGVSKVEHKLHGNMLNCVLVDGEERYQLDLICVKDASLDFAHSYLSWNDVSTILLRVVSRMGLAVGINGLSLSIRQGTNKLGRVMLTRNFEAALNYLGLDYQRWTKGFNNLEEIYEFFSEWKGFSAHAFILERMNEGDRKSVMKRPGYLAFLQWIAEHPEKKKRFDWKSYYQIYREELWTVFPQAKVDHDAIFADLQRKKDCHEKFNGHVVAAITGLQHKALGEFIAKFRKQYASPDQFNEFVMNASQEEINALIKTKFEEMQNH